MKPPPLAGRLLRPLPASAALRSLLVIVPTPPLGGDQNALGSVSAHRWCALSPLASTLTTHLATRRARVEERKCDREGLVHLCALLPRQRREELHSVGRRLQLGGHGNIRQHRKHPRRTAARTHHIYASSGKRGVADEPLQNSQVPRAQQRHKLCKAWVL